MAFCKTALLMSILVIMAVCLGCAKTEETGPTGNPATTYCIEHDGTPKDVQSDAGTRGVCVLSDGTECDDWAYFRGECP